jgi:hypothetical protein
MPSFSHLISASLGEREKKEDSLSSGRAHRDRPHVRGRPVLFFFPLFFDAELSTDRVTTTEVGRERQCQRLAEKEGERDQLGTLWHMSAS